MIKFERITSYRGMGSLLKVKFLIHFKGCQLTARIKEVDNMSAQSVLLEKALLQQIHFFLISDGL